MLEPFAFRLGSFGCSNSISRSSSFFSTRSRYSSRSTPLSYHHTLREQIEYVVIVYILRQYYPLHKLAQLLLRLKSPVGHALEGLPLVVLLLLLFFLITHHIGTHTCISLSSFLLPLIHTYLVFFILLVPLLPLIERAEHF